MAVAFDASSSGQFASGLSVTVSHTCASGAMLVVFVGYSFVAFTTVSGVTYNGVAMTSQGSVTNGSNQRLMVFTLTNPASGANNIVVSFNDNTSLAMGVIGVSVTGAGSIADYTAAGPTTSTTPSVTIPSIGAGDMPVAGALTLGNPTDGDTAIVEIFANSNHYVTAGRQAVGGDGVINWTTGASDVWLAAGVRFVDATAGGRTTRNTRSFPLGISAGMGFSQGGA